MRLLSVPVMYWPMTTMLLAVALTAAWVGLFGWGVYHAAGLVSAAW